MKEYNNNQNSSRGEIDICQFNAKETVGNIQNISRNIKEYSLRMRETMKTLRESGAISEIAEVIREGSFAVRDTVKDISETTYELQKNGIIVDTANAIENTLKSVEESVTTAKEISTDVAKTSPQTANAVQHGIDTVKKETNQVTGKVITNIKNKVGAR